MVGNILARVAVEEICTHTQVAPRPTNDHPGGVAVRARVAVH